MMYVFLALAIVAEVVATSLLKTTEGFTRLWPTLGCLAGYGAAFLLLTQALERGMQVGVAYAVWSGLGTTLIVIIGMLFLGEPLTAAKVAGVVLVVAGVVTLNLAGAH
ncbi:multidrug efflux SMR transporter [Nonomuraea sp. SMC257]|uniref:Multidrug efflux SMR transporter n=1 Tax=Nonomuraea montanisoli TaxID=2741721 RepID=A0A7Y6I757_9ACTN|nr:multidrug efflux SMR transporter [Nonomuraea montanisoli]NUW32005.1 multidrug efflux SMR transporter [Nonomuraea montanisoli]